MMFKKLALSFALISSAAFAGDVSIETYTGVVETPENPQKIAVFDVAAMDTLSALNVPVAGVVTPYFVSYLDDYAKDVSSVGSLFEPDFEAINALAPDLIVAGGRSSTQIPALSKLAPTIDMTIYETPLTQGLARLDAYGALFGKTDEAAALKTAFEAKLNAVKDVVANQGNALILMTNGPKISVYGASGRMGWLHTELGIAEAVKDAETSTHGEAITFEFIRDANPDILFVVDRLSAIGRDGESAKATLDNALVHETNAWKNDKVVYLSSAPIYIAGGGIQSMSLTLDEISAAFAQD